MHKTIAKALMILVLGAASAPAPAEAARRIPKDHHWGRCLLIVHGQTRISGRCIYRWDGGGDFYITGPRQVFEGIDYSNPGLGLAGEQSQDYWARVFKDDDGTWTGYASATRWSLHGDPFFEPLTQRGACFDGKTAGGVGDVKICLWRE